MITSLPIFSGEKVYGGFMTYSEWEMEAIRGFDKADDWRGHHFSGSFTTEEPVFFPRSLPFYGKYDDYGGIDIDPEWKTRASLRVTTDQFITDIVPRNDTKYEMWPKLTPPYDIDDLIDVAERGALHVKASGGHAVPVALWMVKAEVYEMMRGMRNSDMRWHTHMQELYDREKQRLLNDARNNWWSGSEDKRIESIMSLIGELSPYHKAFGHQVPNAGWFTHWARENLVDESTMQGLLDEADAFADFVSAMRRGRYPFRAVCGAGSQDDAMEVQKAVAQVVLDAKDSRDD